MFPTPLCLDTRRAGNGVNATTNDYAVITVVAPLDVEHIRDRFLVAAEYDKCASAHDPGTPSMVVRRFWRSPPQQRFDFPVCW